MIEMLHTKKFRLVIWTFSFQNYFQKKFLTSGSGQIENTQIHVFAYCRFDHFPKSKIDSESSFEIRKSILQFYIFLWIISMIKKKFQK